MGGLRTPASAVRDDAPAASGAASKANLIAGALWALVVVVVALGILGLAMHAGYLTPPK